MIKTWVSLYVYSDDLSPDEISQELGLKPDWTRKKGQKLREGRLLVAKQHVWKLASGCKETVPAEEQLARLLDKLDGKLTEIRRLGANNLVYVAIAASIYNPDYNYQYSFDKVVLDRLNRMQLALAFDLYSFSDPDDQTLNTKE